MLKLGWFSSGGEGSRFLLENVLLKKPSNVSIEWVFMNKDPEEDENTRKYAELCHSAGIHLYYEPWKGMKERWGTDDIKWLRNLYDDEYIASLLEVIPKVDYIFLVGYMRIITGKKLLKYPMINLHPGLPGGHKGTYKEVIEKLKKESKDGLITTGSMTHYVSKDLDGGRPIMFFRFTCRPEYDIIREKTLEREQYLLIKTMEYLNTPVDVTRDIVKMRDEYV